MRKRNHQIDYLGGHTVWKFPNGSPAWLNRLRDQIDGSAIPVEEKVAACIRELNALARKARSEREAAYYRRCLIGFLCLLSQRKRKSRQQC